MNLTLEEIQRIFILNLGEKIRSAEITRNKLRILLTDESFVDIFCSINIENRWAFHWERTHVDGTIYRHDNIPHLSWKQIG
ncbi:MAG: hypothetical protein EU530_05590 [Promethearchaeota archaeon]|nr:MAG: hypothetical protein EU530_05590 [Candidatus Lokiarchaeota archaeon]